MHLLFNFRSLFSRLLIDVKWYGILLGIAAYGGSSWGLLWLCGEADLITRSDFIYWLLVTASTVGYGDLSPVTTPGKYVVALFVIPFGLGLFGLAIGRVAAFVSHQWRKGVMGLKNLAIEDHILVIGWNGNRTLHLMKLLLNEIQTDQRERRLALCVRVEVENPMREEIGFVRVPAFTDDAGMDRAGIAKASCIIIDNPEDDVTMTTALYCSGRNPDAHIIAYFQDEQLGQILKQHCPNVECMPSVSVEMMAKAAADPGSSALHHELLAVNQGMTQYSMAYPGKEEVAVRTLFNGLKEHFDATLIGVRSSGSGSIDVNPALDAQVRPGCTLYYIAEARICNMDWSRI